MASWFDSMKKELDQPQSAEPVTGIWNLDVYTTDKYTRTATRKQAKELFRIFQKTPQSERRNPSFISQARTQLMLLRLYNHGVFMQKKRYPRTRWMFYLLCRYVALEYESLGPNPDPKKCEGDKLILLLENILSKYFDVDSEIRCKVFIVHIIVTAFQTYKIPEWYMDLLTELALKGTVIQKQLDELYSGDDDLLYVGNFWFNDQLKYFMEVDEFGTDDEASDSSEGEDSRDLLKLRHRRKNNNSSKLAARLKRDIDDDEIIIIKDEKDMSDCDSARDLDDSSPKVCTDKTARNICQNGAIKKTSSKTSTNNSEPGRQTSNVIVIIDDDEEDVQSDKSDDSDVELINSPDVVSPISDMAKPICVDDDNASTVSRKGLLNKNIVLDEDDDFIKQLQKLATSVGPINERASNNNNIETSIDLISLNEEQNCNLQKTNNEHDDKQQLNGVDNNNLKGSISLSASDKDKIKEQENAGKHSINVGIEQRNLESMPNKTAYVHNTNDRIIDILDDKHLKVSQVNLSNKVPSIEPFQNKHNLHVGTTRKNISARNEQQDLNTRKVIITEYNYKPCTDDIQHNSTNKNVSIIGESQKPLEFVTNKSITGVQNSSHRSNEGREQMPQCTTVEIIDLDELDVQEVNAKPEQKNVAVENTTKKHNLLPFKKSLPNLPEFLQSIRGLNHNANKPNCSLKKGNGLTSVFPEVSSTQVISDDEESTDNHENTTGDTIKSAPDSSSIPVEIIKDLPSNDEVISSGISKSSEALDPVKVNGTEDTSSSNEGTSLGLCNTEKDSVETLVNASEDISSLDVNKADGDLSKCDPVIEASVVDDLRFPSWMEKLLGTGSAKPVTQDFGPMPENVVVSNVCSDKTLNTKQLLQDCLFGDDSGTHTPSSESKKSFVNAKPKRILKKVSFADTLPSNSVRVNTTFKKVSFNGNDKRDLSVKKVSFAEMNATSDEDKNKSASTKESQISLDVKKSMCKHDEKHNQVTECKRVEVKELLQTDEKHKQLPTVSFETNGTFDELNQSGKNGHTGKVDENTSESTNQDDLNNGAILNEQENGLNSVIENDDEKLNNEIVDSQQEEVISSTTIESNLLSLERCDNLLKEANDETQTKLLLSSEVDKSIFEITETNSNELTSASIVEDLPETNEIALHSASNISCRESEPTDLISSDLGKPEESTFMEIESSIAIPEEEIKQIDNEPSSMEFAENHSLENVEAANIEQSLIAESSSDVTLPKVVFEQSKIAESSSDVTLTDVVCAIDTEVETSNAEPEMIPKTLYEDSIQEVNSLVVSNEEMVIGECQVETVEDQGETFEDNKNGSQEGTLDVPEEQEGECRKDKVQDRDVTLINGEYDFKSPEEITIDRVVHQERMGAEQQDGNIDDLITTTTNEKDGIVTEAICNLEVEVDKSIEIECNHSDVSEENQLQLNEPVLTEVQDTIQSFGELIDTASDVRVDSIIKTEMNENSSPIQVDLIGNRNVCIVEEDHVTTENDIISEIVKNQYDNHVNIEDQNTSQLEIDENQLNQCDNQVNAGDVNPSQLEINENQLNRLETEVIAEEINTGKLEINENHVIAEDLNTAQLEMNENQLNHLENEVIAEDINTGKPEMNENQVIVEDLNTSHVEINENELNQHDNQVIAEDLNTARLEINENQLNHHDNQVIAEDLNTAQLEINENQLNQNDTQMNAKDINTSQLQINSNAIHEVPIYDGLTREVPLESLNSVNDDSYFHDQVAENQAAEENLLNTPNPDCSSEKSEHVSSEHVKEFYSSNIDSSVIDETFVGDSHLDIVEPSTNEVIIDSSITDENVLIDEQLHVIGEEQVVAVMEELHEVPVEHFDELQVSSEVCVVIEPSQFEVNGSTDLEVINEVCVNTTDSTSTQTLHGIISAANDVLYNQNGTDDVISLHNEKGDAAVISSANESLVINEDSHNLIIFSEPNSRECDDNFISSSNQNDLIDKAVDNSVSSTDPIVDQTGVHNIMANEAAREVLEHNMGIFMDALEMSLSSRREEEETSVKTPKKRGRKKGVKKPVGVSRITRSSSKSQTREKPDEIVDGSSVRLTRSKNTKNKPDISSDLEVVVSSTEFTSEDVIKKGKKYDIANATDESVVDSSPKMGRKSLKMEGTPKASENTEKGKKGRRSVKYESLNNGEETLILINTNEENNGGKSEEVANDEVFERLKASESFVKGKKGRRSSKPEIVITSSDSSKHAVNRQLLDTDDNFKDKKSQSKSEKVSSDEIKSVDNTEKVKKGRKNLKHGIGSAGEDSPKLGGKSVKKSRQPKAINRKKYENDDGISENNDTLLGAKVYQDVEQQKDVKTTEKKLKVTGTKNRKIDHNEVEKSQTTSNKPSYGETIDDDTNSGFVKKPTFNKTMYSNDDSSDSCEDKLVISDEPLVLTPRKEEKKKISVEIKTKKMCDMDIQAARVPTLDEVVKQTTTFKDVSKLVNDHYKINDNEHKVEYKVIEEVNNVEHELVNGKENTENELVNDKEYTENKLINDKEHLEYKLVKDKENSEHKPLNVVEDSVDAGKNVNIEEQSDVKFVNNSNNIESQLDKNSVQNLSKMNFIRTKAELKSYNKNGPNETINDVNEEVPNVSLQEALTDVKTFIRTMETDDVRTSPSVEIPSQELALDYSLSHFKKYSLQRECNAQSKQLNEELYSTSNNSEPVDDLTTIDDSLKTLPQNADQIKVDERNECLPSTQNDALLNRIANAANYSAYSITNILKGDVSPKKMLKQDNATFSKPVLSEKQFATPMNGNCSNLKQPKVILLDNILISPKKEYRTSKSFVSISTAKVEVDFHQNLKQHNECNQIPLDNNSLQNDDIGSKEIANLPEIAHEPTSFVANDKGEDLSTKYDDNIQISAKTQHLELKDRIDPIEPSVKCEMADPITITKMENIKTHSMNSQHDGTLKTREIKGVHDDISTAINEYQVELIVIQGENLEAKKEETTEIYLKTETQIDQMESSDLDQKESVVIAQKTSETVETEVTAVVKDVKTGNACEIIDENVLVEVPEVNQIDNTDVEVKQMDVVLDAVNEPGKVKSHKKSALAINQEKLHKSVKNSERSQQVSRKSRRDSTNELSIAMKNNNDGSNVIDIRKKSINTEKTAEKVKTAVDSKKNKTTKNTKSTDENVKLDNEKGELTIKPLDKDDDGGKKSGKSSLKDSRSSSKNKYKEQSKSKANETSTEIKTDGKSLKIEEKKLSTNIEKAKTKENKLGKCSEIKDKNITKSKTIKYESEIVDDCIKSSSSKFKPEVKDKNKNVKSKVAEEESETSKRVKSEEVCKTTKNISSKSTSTKVKEEIETKTMLIEGKASKKPRRSSSKAEDPHSSIKETSEVEELVKKEKLKRSSATSQERRASEDRSNRKRKDDKEVKTNKTSSKHDEKSKSITEETHSLVKGSEIKPKESKEKSSKLRNLEKDSQERMIEDITAKIGDVLEKDNRNKKNSSKSKTSKSSLSENKNKKRNIPVEGTQSSSRVGDDPDIVKQEVTRMKSPVKSDDALQKPSDSLITAEQLEVEVALNGDNLPVETTSEKEDKTLTNKKSKNIQEKPISVEPTVLQKEDSSRTSSSKPDDDVPLSERVVHSNAEDSNVKKSSSRSKSSRKERRNSSRATYSENTNEPSAVHKTEDSKDSVEKFELVQTDDSKDSVDKIELIQCKLKDDKTEALKDSVEKIESKSKEMENVNSLPEKSLGIAECLEIRETGLSTNASESQEDHQETLKINESLETVNVGNESIEILDLESDRKRLKSTDVLSKRCMRKNKKQKKEVDQPVAKDDIRNFVSTDLIKEKQPVFENASLGLIEKDEIHTNFVVELEDKLNKDKVENTVLIDKDENCVEKLVNSRDKLVLENTKVIEGTSECIENHKSIPSNLTEEQAKTTKQDILIAEEKSAASDLDKRVRELNNVGKMQDNVIGINEKEDKVKKRKIFDEEQSSKKKKVSPEKDEEVQVKTIASEAPTKLEIVQISNLVTKEVNNVKVAKASDTEKLGEVKTKSINTVILRLQSKCCEDFVGRKDLNDHTNNDFTEFNGHELESAENVSRIYPSTSERECCDNSNRKRDITSETSVVVDKSLSTQSLKTDGKVDVCLPKINNESSAKEVWVVVKDEKSHMIPRKLRIVKPVDVLKEVKNNSNSDVSPKKLRAEKRIMVGSVQLTQSEDCCNKEIEAMNSQEEIIANTGSILVEETSGNQKHETIHVSAINTTTVSSVDLEQAAPVDASTVHIQHPVINQSNIFVQHPIITNQPNVLVQQAEIIDLSPTLVQEPTTAGQSNVLLMEQPEIHQRNLVVQEPAEQTSIVQRPLVESLRAQVLNDVEQPNIIVEHLPQYQDVPYLQTGNEMFPSSEAFVLNVDFLADKVTSGRDIPVTLEDFKQINSQRSIKSTVGICGVSGLVANAKIDEETPLLDLDERMLCEKIREQGSYEVKNATPDNTNPGGPSLSEIIVNKEPKLNPSRGVLDDDSPGDETNIFHFTEQVCGELPQIGENPVDNSSEFQFPEQDGHLSFFAENDLTQESCLIDPDTSENVFVQTDCKEEKVKHKDDVNYYASLEDHQVSMNDSDKSIREEDFTQSPMSIEVMNMLFNKSLSRVNAMEEQKKRYEFESNSRALIEKQSRPEGHTFPWSNIGQVQVDDTMSSTTMSPESVMKKKEISPKEISTIFLSKPEEQNEPIPPKKKPPPHKRGEVVLLNIQKLKGDKKETNKMNYQLSDFFVNSIRGAPKESGGRSRVMRPDHFVQPSPHGLDLSEYHNVTERDARRSRRNDRKRLISEVGTDVRQMGDGKKEEDLFDAVKKLDPNTLPLINSSSAPGNIRGTRKPPCDFPPYHKAEQPPYKKPKTNIIDPEELSKSFAREIEKKELDQYHPSHSSRHHPPRMFPQKSAEKYDGYIGSSSHGHSSNRHSNSHPSRKGTTHQHSLNRRGSSYRKEHESEHRMGTRSMQMEGRSSHSSENSGSRSSTSHGDSLYNRQFGYTGSSSSRDNILMRSFPLSNFRIGNPRNQQDTSYLLKVDNLLSNPKVTFFHDR